MLGRKFSGMIHNNYQVHHPSNPQQPIHSLRLAPVRKKWYVSPWGVTPWNAIFGLGDPMVLFLQGLRDAGFVHGDWPEAAGDFWRKMGAVEHRLSVWRWGSGGNHPPKNKGCPGWVRKKTQRKITGNTIDFWKKELLCKILKLNQ